jgi:hypothetical protein
MVAGWIRPQDVSINPQPIASNLLFSQPAFFELVLGFGSFAVVFRFGFAVAFANQAFHFFADEVNRGVQIFLAIFGEEVRTADAEANGAGELFLRGAIIVVFQRDASVNGPLVEVVQLLNFAYDVIFNGFGQRDVVRDDDQFHDQMMLPASGKIQRKKFAPGEIEPENRSWGAPAAGLLCLAARQTLRLTISIFLQLGIKLWDEVFGGPPKTTREPRALPAPTPLFGVSPPGVRQRLRERIESRGGLTIYA